MTALSTQDILADLFPEQTIINLREGIARGTFGPFTPASKPQQSNERQLAELRRVKRRGTQSFGADPSFDSDREVLAMFDTLDADIQGRAARGDYARAGSRDELAYQMGFDIEARQFGPGLDDELADAITLGKFSPRAVITNQSIRTLMQPLHDSVLGKVPAPNPDALRDSVDDQTAANGFMSDAQRVIEAQPDDATRVLVSEQLGRSLDGDVAADGLHSTIGGHTRAAYAENRNSGLEIDPQTPVVEDEDIERMNLIVRAASQFVNPALELVEQARPTTSLAGGLGTLESAWDDIVALDDAPWYRKVDRMAVAWWSLTKGYYTGGKEAEQALRAARGDVTIDVPPAETFGEKVVDVGAGLASFVAQMVLLRRIVPADVPSSLRGAVIFEMQSLSQGGVPGKGAVLGGALQGIGGIATKGLAGEVGKVAAESALFAGLTAAEGGDEVDIILSALVPVGLRGSSLARKQFRTKIVAAKTPEQISDVFRESRFFREEHAEAVQFVENASPETLARVRAKHAPRMKTDPVSAAMVELIDSKGSVRVAPEPKPPVTRVEPKQEIVPEVKPKEDPAKPSEEPDVPRGTQAEPDALAVRANDRGLAEGAYDLPTGTLEVYTPVQVGDQWGIFDSIDDFTDAPRPLTWSEAVAEADRRNVEISGVEGATGIKAVEAPETALEVETADVTPEPEGVELAAKEPAQIVEEELDLAIVQSNETTAVVSKSGSPQNQITVTAESPAALIRKLWKDHKLVPARKEGIFKTQRLMDEEKQQAQPAAEIEPDNRTRRELVERAKELGVKSSGNKPDILARVQEAEAAPPTTQITDPDAPNFDRRGFSLNFAAEAADAVLKGGSFTFRTIRETVSRLLAGVSSRLHGLLDRIVNLTSRIVGRSVNPDGTINKEAQTAAVAENQTQLRSHVDPNRWLPAERQHVQDVGRLRNIAPGAINQTQDAIARIASRAVEGKRWTVAAQITAANNGFLNAIWNVIEDPIRPLRGNLDGSGIYSGDRMNRVLGLVDMHKREAMELRSKMTADITRALGLNANIRAAGEAMGISGLQQQARTLADRTFVTFDRLNRAKRNLQQMEGDEATQQNELIAALTARVDADMATFPADVQSGVRKAFADFITARNDTARNRQMQTDASAYLNQVHRRWKDHAVVQFNSAEIRSAEDYDNAIRQIYGLPDPLDVTEEPTSIFQPGVVVKAADRENFGTVLKIDAEAETATVKFVNPRNGATAIRDLPIDTLTPTDGKVLVPTRRRIDGVNEVSTIELRDSAWWKTKGKDIDFATDRQFILDSMNSAQIAVNVKGETPRMNTLIENTALHFADIDSSEFISGKRREAISNHFINLANSELGLRGAEKQPTWQGLIEYARIMRDEAGLDIADPVSEQREIAAEAAMIDLITAIEGIQINQEDATGLIPTLFQAADSYSTAVQLVFSAASTANEMYQTTDLMIKHAGIVEGIGQIGRGVLVNLTKGMNSQMKTDFEELAWGLMSLDPYKLSRVDETTLAASQDPGGASRSTSQQLNERPGVSQWIKGVLLTGSRGAVEASLSGKVFGKGIPGLRQGSLDYWSTNLRQIGVMAEMGVLTKRIPDLAAIWRKLRSGEAENPGQAIKQLKAEKKLQTRITPQYYRLVAPRMQGQLERLAERLESGDGIKRMFGMNVFVGNEASDRAVKRYLDLFIMNVATNTPRRSDIPSVIQKQGAMRMLLRFLLKYQNQATAFMNGRGALTRTESTRGALFLVGGLMGYTMFEMFLRDVIRRGVDGAVERIEEKLSTPEGVAIYGSQVLGRSNVLGPVDREIVPAIAAALAPNEYRRSQAIKDAAGGPVFGVVSDMLSVPFIFDQERSGDRLSTPEKRLLNRLLIVPSTPAGTLIRGLQMVPNKFPGSFIISDEDEKLRSGIGLPN